MLNHLKPLVFYTSHSGGDLREYSGRVQLERLHSSTKVTAYPTDANGTSLHFNNWRKTDEGWASSALHVKQTEDGWEIETVSDGADCDGRLTTGMKWVSTGEFDPGWPREESLLLPLDSWQRDHRAEAAGY